MFRFLYKLIPLLLLLSLSYQLSAQAWLDQAVTLQVEEQPLSEVLFMLSEQTNVALVFNSAWPEMEQGISIQVDDKPLRQVLQECLTPANLGFKISGVVVSIVRLRPSKYRLSGYLEDRATGERLVSATIWSAKLGKGVTTNGYGFFSWELPAGKSQISCSYLGYQTMTFDIDLHTDQNVLWTLDASVDLPEVIVRPENTGVGIVRGNQGDHFLSREQLQQQAGLGGEPDVFAIVHQQTATQRGADGLGGLYVRGGRSDQNLVLLDDVPVFQPTHSLGLFSVINPLLMRSAEFFPDAFPARFAGRLSSVLDVRTKEGSTQASSVEASTSLLVSSIVVETPLVQGKSGLLLAARRSHIDPWLRRYSSRQKLARDEEGQTDYHFYDLNAKWHTKLGANDRLLLSLFRGRDNYGDYNYGEFLFDEEVEQEGFFIEELWQDLSYSNTIGALRWNHLFNGQLFANTTATYSRFNYRSDNTYYYDEVLGTDTLLSFNYSRFQSSIRDLRLKTDFDYFPSQIRQASFGATALWRTFLPGALQVNIEEDSLRIDEVVSLWEQSLVREPDEAWEFGLYSQQQWQWDNGWVLRLGGHMAFFQRNQHWYTSLQPRLLLQYQAKPQWQWRFSFDRMTQFLHQLTYSGAGLPTDLWVPATAEYGPSQTWQMTLGGRHIWNDRWQSSLQLYYKWQDELLRYFDETQIPKLEETTGDFWELEVVSGSADNWGLTWNNQWMWPNAKLQLLYAYQQNRHVFPELNEGNPFPFSFERPHKVILGGHFNISTKCKLQFHWEYASGRPITLVASEYRFAALDNFLFPIDEQLSTLNGYRLPAYHRLDISLHWQFRRPQTIHTIVLGMYNTYNRQNTFFAYQYEDSFFPEDSGLREQHSLPLLPTLSYRFKLWTNQ